MVAENGGRVFWPVGDGSCAGGDGGDGVVLEEDVQWRARIVEAGACGGLEQDEMAPSARSGAVWALYHELEKEGWSVDSNGYTTSFRVKFPQPNPSNSLEKVSECVSECVSACVSAWVRAWVRE